MPDQMFYNTGISTYVWILTNQKPEHRRGLVALVDGRESFAKMRKSLGDKRKYLPDEAIDELVRLFVDLPDDPRVKVMPNESFGFQRLTVERPLRRRWEVTDEVVALLPEPLRAPAEGERGTTWPTESGFATWVTGLEPVTQTGEPSVAQPLDAKAKRLVLRAAAVYDEHAAPIMKKGVPEPDADLRDQENIPLPEGYLVMTDRQRAKALHEQAEAHLREQVHPYVPDAWIDHVKTKIGYEIPFTRQFYVYTPPRPVDEISAELRELEVEIQTWMQAIEL